MSGKTRHPRRKRAPIEEEHENHERWMVSYADMLTLLFVLFVVLFAMSQLDEQKFKALKVSLSMGFGADSVAFTGQQSPMNGQSAADETFPVDLSPGAGSDKGMGAERTDRKNSAVKRLVSAAVVKATQERLAAQRAAARQEADDFKRVQRMIIEALKKKGVDQDVKFAIDQRGLVVTVLTSEVIFANGSADLLSTGREIIDAVGPALRTLPNHIEVDGHTNSLPMHSAQFPSNWELSTGRATTVVRYLVSKEKLPSARLSAAGFADQRPLHPYSDPRAMRLNRRVEIVVLSKLSSEEKVHLPYVATEGP